MNFLLIGKPNVGKSSIFNILSSQKKNIIHKTEGTTRDWHQSLVKGFDNIFLYDTPGIIIKNKKTNLFEFDKLINNIDYFLYVIDYRGPENLEDLEALNKIRKFNKKCILLINKDDNFEKKYNFDYLGIKNYYFLSCSHKHGFSDLYNFFDSFNCKEKNILSNDFTLAIFGKPNAGKSTLVNSFLGYNRVLTSSIAGTTSDFVEDSYIYNKKNFKILDTAGILKKNKIKKKTVNFEAVKKSLNIIYKIDLSILLIDSEDGFDNQVKKILNILLLKSNSVLIVFNKIDLIKNKNKYIAEQKLIVNETFSQTKNISFIFLSSLSKYDVQKLKKFIFLKTKIYSIKLSTSKINTWLKSCTAEYKHPLVNGKVVKFKYGVQISNKPLTIKIFSNFSSKIKKNYKIYLVNNFSKTFKIKDQKIKLIITSSNNPFN